MDLRYVAPRLVLLIGIAAFTTMLRAPTQALAQSQERCFAETGYCIAGPIRTYWERNGGLPVFGFPISSLTTESVEGQVIPVQWFQRDRLEDHGRDGVMAGRLGAQLLETMGRPWQPRVPAEVRGGCRTFPETGYAVCEPFLSYWERNGGLARFGYPLSSVEEQIIGDWVGDVQYFERRRMEHHAELSGTPYEVLLGLLGQTIRDVAAADACAQPIRAQWRAAFTSLSFGGTLGCPLPVKEEVPMAIQPFEGGQMIWVDLGADGRQIVVELRGRAEPTAPRRALYVAMLFQDTWDEGQPIDSGLTPPASRLEPQRGFGKLWRERPLIRQSLGWATAPEQPAQGIYQGWTSGGAMISAPDVSDVHHGFYFVRAFLPNSRDELVRQ
jgi:hypothetical protein